MLTKYRGKKNYPKECEKQWTKNRPKSWGSEEGAQTESWMHELETEGKKKYMSAQNSKS